jgi:organic radical activating enzyme
MFVETAAGIGYRTLSISGGEPLLYRELPALLAAAKDCSMATQIATNGMLAHPRVLAELQGLADRFAVSVDGSAPTHDRSRGQRGAFERMSAGLRRIQDAGYLAQAIVTVNRESLEELDQVLGFLLEEGVRDVQFHPIEIAGRAASTSSSLALDDEDAARLFVWFHLQRAALGDEGRMHLDLAPSAAVPEPPEPVLPVLVVETDGFVVPISFGIDRAYGIGHVGDSGCAQNLIDASDSSWGDLSALNARAWAALQMPDAPRFVQWPDWVVRTSARFDGAASPSGEGDQPQGRRKGREPSRSRSQLMLGGQRPWSRAGIQRFPERR